MILASWVPGALGLVLRSTMYRWILGSVGRNVVFGVNVTLRHPHKITSATTSSSTTCLLPRREGHRQPRHHHRQRRLHRPQYHSQLQERRHRHRGSRQHRLQLRSLLGVESARRERHPDGRLHLPGGRRSLLRPHRHSGAAAGPNRAWHRCGRRHVAWHARGGDRWIHDRTRCIIGAGASASARFRSFRSRPVFRRK